MSHLFSPLALGPLSLSNRVVIAPMCQYSSEEGRATDWHAFHWPNLAQSGAGLVIIEATAVEPRGRISWADLGLWDDTTEAAFAKALAATRRYSRTPIGVQLAHAGRKASTHRPWDDHGAQVAPDAAHGWPTVSASSLAYSEGQHPPLALDQVGIDTVIAAFVDSARRAVRLGLDLIEIHAAHGYLLHQFLSPLSNQRDDAYGGSLENRMRLVLQVFDAIKAVVPDEMAVGIRISATDWVEGGWDLAQSIALAKALDARGCHFIDVSSGGLHPAQKIALEPGYQVPFAQAIKQEVAMPVIAVGLITEPQQADDILQHAQADAIAIARGILYDPRWPWHAAAALEARVAIAPQYLRSAPREHAARFVQAT
ncbi:2,4-dienoyl-CoA reductase-like NADH-dependent reductase (Old Yellow Enzyme family) [Pseudoxanthomonas japonensis]|uniref:NADH:flavin oxidoreductase/NADH oxidase n=1 Tax=Pseudoxanthomonas japonensis TaxID=69284 RepID=UPI001A5606C4|nr:NADH:flavin oxidoreductase/NADH oxidase [Pseudoxanthomonas japonensis]MBL8257397.1 NADH:flavin oxidoreductase/NADH oxidase [Pseudoxanthomonas mexicana]MDR7069860.1 2,4-dienoyl-CoA reductase-like NADH-dependent reductase (Old Yellow Enzyme family) [Pseudoxanthomonas japonensis]